MNRVGGAVAGGLAGTALMSLVFVLMEVQTRYVLHIFDVIARFVRRPGDPYVGFVLFAVAGVVVWPLLFVALEEYIPRGPDPAVQGMVFALPLWVLFAVTGRGDLAWPTLLIYATFTLFAHLVYGFTMGAVYAALAEGRSPTVEPARQ